MKRAQPGWSVSDIRGRHRNTPLHMPHGLSSGGALRRSVGAARAIDYPPRMIRAVIPAVLAALAVLAAPPALAPASPASAAELTTADRAWIAACVDRLKNESAPGEDTKLRYCTCMHEQFDDNRPVTQTEMERLYPPVHRGCNRESGWK